MKKTFQIFLLLFGIIAIFIAMMHIVIGPSSIPGSLPVNPTMDSEERFYASLFGAYGVALIWCVRDIEQKSKVVYFLAATFLAGGIARIVSIAAVGWPNPFFLAMGLLELVIPFYMAFAQWRIASGAKVQMKQNMVDALPPRP